jgi:uncharacterized protein (TIGR00730 family)
VDRIVTVCVFCGSKPGNDPVYQAAARQVGRELAGRSLDLVYGGGRVGLMGAVADAALEAGARVTGVMPRSLVEQEIAHRSLTTLHVVETMHERKVKMAELADAFIALPGGAGTFEEIFEQWTWGQLGIHEKPCGFLNVRGYFDPLIAMIDRMVAEAFLTQAHADMIVFADTTAALLDHFSNYIAPKRKWFPESAGATKP